MPRTTATVETLTAEVRVLMVGSRQVTLSVYGQLDEVKQNEIEPFGRVSPKDADPAWTYVVGRHLETRELVRSRTLTDRERIKWALEDRKKEADVLIRNAEAFRHADEDDRQSGRRSIMGWGQEAEKAEAKAREIWAEVAVATVQMEADAVKWENLPLIVLAGLR